MATFLGIAERLDFRVRSAGLAMPALTNDLSTLHQHRSDHRIWGCQAITAPGKAEGKTHEWVGDHIIYRSGNRQCMQIHKNLGLLLTGRLA